MLAILNPLGAFGRRRAVRTPTVLQLEASECGAASLSMVLAYYGRRATLEELRLACGVSRDGSKASSILRAARSYGMKAKGLKAEPEQLASLNWPMIAFVNFCHFVVVEGIDDRYAYINDPAVGRYPVSREEFDAMFTGVVLVFEPDTSFERGDSRPSLSASLLRRTRGFRTAISFLVLVSLAMVIPGIALPVFSRVFVDYVIVLGLDGWLVPLLAGMALTAVVRFLLSLLNDWHLIRAETRLAIRGAREIFEHILKLPVPFFGVRYAGEVASRIDLSGGLAQLLTGDLARACLSLISAVFFFAIMCLYSVPLAFAVLALNAAGFVAFLVIARSLADGYRKLSIQEGKLSGVSLSGLQDMETFKAAGSEALFFTRWTGLHAGIVRIEQGMGFRSALLASAPALITALTAAFIVVYGGYEVMHGAMTIGSLVAFQTLAASFVAPLNELMNLGASLQQVRSFTERIDDVLLQQPDPRTGREREIDALCVLPAGSLSLENVSFGYFPLERPLIENLSLVAKPGSRIAIVGASGCGKSTVGRLLVGLLPASEGRVLLDGRELSEWPHPVLSASLAYVDQNIVLFEGTVRDNLTMWDDTVPDHDMVAAAHDAMIHEVISERPGGYNSIVEEGGRNFSGGQRQRLEIARALVTGPKVIVLDEATSALDTLAEEAIMENLRRRGCTLVIVAHRVSTIRYCDEVAYFEEGRLTEFGSHDALLAQDGGYARLMEVWHR